MSEITRELESVEPSGAVMDLLLGADLDQVSDEQKVTMLVLVRKLLGPLQHLELALLAGVEDLTEAAMAIHEPEQALVREKEHSTAADILPRLFDLLRQGQLDARRLEIVRERVVNLPSLAMITQVEDGLIDQASTLTRTELARLTTKLVATIDPTGYEQRRQKATTRDRRVEYKPLPEGQAELRVRHDALHIRQMFDTLTADARALTNDDRTTDQKRADAALDRFMGNGVNRTVQVHVTVSLETLMGLTEDPGLLDGYGPISADAARELAMHNPWRGILLDQYRHATAMTTDKYRPDARCREFVKVRDGGTCSAPGCTTPIQEIDHTVPWPQGKTDPAQLRGYCMTHHHKKHANHTVTLDPDGTTHWTTPQGRHYTTQPHQY
ncbi:DUF222 domain-containing protein [Kutzneria sp. NPDC052558]|uniref:HNH endonuclease signature motif containing protein n=1 Tax=Kutzneria sp. NPDC052558 TaxID=3364121 RepID=UPI0037C5D942